MKLKEPIFEYINSEVKYEVINADCYNHLLSESSEKFDLIITSPPYNIGKEKEYCDIANERITSLLNGDLKIRPMNKPIHVPSKNEKIAKVPKEWKQLDILGLVKHQS